MAEDEALPGRWRDTAEGPELDLRGLEPPEPMVGILGRIEADPHRPAFTVRLERDPVHLFPELAERGWGWQYLPVGPGEVRLRLERQA